MVELNNIDDLHNKYEERWPDTSSDGALPKSVWIYFTHRYERNFRCSRLYLLFSPSSLQTQITVVCRDLHLEGLSDSNKWSEGGGTLMVMLCRIKMNRSELALVKAVESALVPITSYCNSLLFWLTREFSCFFLNLKMFRSHLGVTLFAGFDNIQKKSTMCLSVFPLRWRLVLRSVSSNASEYFRTKETVPIPVAESVSVWF